MSVGDCSGVYTKASSSCLSHYYWMENISINIKTELLYEVVTLVVAVWDCRGGGWIVCSILWGFFVCCPSWRMRPVTWLSSAPRMPSTWRLAPAVRWTLRTSLSCRLTWWTNRDSSESCRNSWTTRKTTKVDGSKVCILLMGWGSNRIFWKYKVESYHYWLKFHQ